MLRIQVPFGFQFDNYAPARRKVTLPDRHAAPAFRQVYKISYLRDHRIVTFGGEQARSACGIPVTLLPDFYLHWLSPLHELVHVHAVAFQPL